MQTHTFSNDQIAAIIGAKELELVSLRMQLSAAIARLRELEPKPPEQPKADVVPITGANDGAS